MGIYIYTKSNPIFSNEDPLLHQLDNDLIDFQNEINEIIVNNNPISQFDLSLMIRYVQGVVNDLNNIKNSSSPQDQQIAQSPEFAALMEALDTPLVSGYPSLIDACKDPSTMDQLLQSLIWMQKGGTSLIALDLLLPIGKFLQAWPSN
jgi:hypothetical protein